MGAGRRMANWSRTCNTKNLTPIQLQHVVVFDKPQVCMQVWLHYDVHACNVPVRFAQAPKTHISKVLWLTSHLLLSKPAWAAASAPGLVPERSEGVGSLWQCHGLRARGPGDRA